jgi:quercetin dioxygenase-like cupin family protein
MVEHINPTHTFDYANSGINVYHANKGQGLPKHNHPFDHATICHSGSCIIRMENKERIVTKKDGAFNLPKELWHEIEALEDNTVFANIFGKENRS